MDQLTLFALAEPAAVPQAVVSEPPPAKLALVKSANTVQTSETKPARGRKKAAPVPVVVEKAQRQQDDEIAFARTLTPNDLIRPEYNGRGWTPVAAEGVNLGNPYANPFDYPRTAAEVEIADAGYISESMEDDYGLLGTRRGVTNPEKCRNEVEKMIRQVSADIQRTGTKYEDLLQTGVASLSNYDLLTQTPGAAWRSCIALLFNQIVYHKTHLAALENALSVLDQQQDQFEAPSSLAA